MATVLELPYNFYREMQPSKYMPSGLVAQEHTGSFEPARHMLTFLVAYSGLYCDLI